MFPFNERIMKTTQQQTNTTAVHKHNIATPGIIHSQQPIGSQDTTESSVHMIARAKPAPVHKENLSTAAATLNQTQLDSSEDNAI